MSLSQRLQGTGCWGGKEKKFVICLRGQIKVTEPYKPSSCRILVKELSWDGTQGGERE